MFERAVMLYLYTETPLHAGKGRGLEAIDLPIQRERITHYPMVYASSLKGRLRAEAQTIAERDQGQSQPRITEEIVTSIFGPAALDGAGSEPGSNAEVGAFGGAISPGDARLLLFPVQSLAGVFAWTTSPAVLQRFVRDTAAIGLTLPAELRPQIEALKVPVDQAWVGETSTVTIETADKVKQVVLEEYSYTAQPQALVDALAAWLGDNALPDSNEYNAWKARLPGHLVILHDEVFRDFARFSTEVITRVRLDTATKTVEGGALWTEESLPSESLLYAPLHAMRTRQNLDRANNNAWLGGARVPRTAEQVLDILHGLNLRRVRLGGDETVGRGSVYIRWSPQTTLGKE